MGNSFFYLLLTGSMVLVLYVYLIYLYSSKTRGENIEKRGQIPFLDKPLEVNKKKR